MHESDGIKSNIKLSLGKKEMPDISIWCFYATDGVQYRQISVIHALGSNTFCNINAELNNQPG